MREDRLITDFVRGSGQAVGFLLAQSERKVGSKVSVNSPHKSFPPWKFPGDPVTHVLERDNQKLFLVSLNDDPRQGCWCGVGAWKLPVA